jgi:hypothetical protein
MVLTTITTCYSALNASRLVVSLDQQLVNHSVTRTSLGIAHPCSNSYNVSRIETYTHFILADWIITTKTGRRIPLSPCSLLLSWSSTAPESSCGRIQLIPHPGRQPWLVGHLVNDCAGKPSYFVWCSQRYGKDCSIEYILLCGGGRSLFARMSFQASSYGFWACQWASTVPKAWQ